jgi:hypothetical protein
MIAAEEELKSSRENMLFCENAQMDSLRRAGSASPLDLLQTFSGNSGCLL